MCVGLTLGSDLGHHMITGGFPPVDPFAVTADGSVMLQRKDRAFVSKRWIDLGSWRAKSAGAT